MDHRSLANRVWYGFCRWICRFVSCLCYRFRFGGAENLPREGGALVVCNHQSFFDPAFVGQCHRRRMNFVARTTLEKYLAYRLITGPLDPIPLDREGIGLAGIKEMLRRIKRGEIVVLFPEGTRTADGSLRKMKPGFAALCKRAKLPIIPAALDGAFQAWPRGQKLPGRGVVQMEFGEPIPHEEYSQWTDDELVEQVKQHIGCCLAKARKLRLMRIRGRD